MIHTHRCGNGCRNLVTGPNYPAGACHYAGVIVRLEPRTREFLDVRGCCSYREPKTNIIDADEDQKNRYKLRDQK
jgi:hypothetical protein